MYPVIYDSNGVVLSLPPIINGDHSKIKVETKNIFIECTATDYTKALITLNTVVALFSQFANPQFSVEEVEVQYEKDNIIRVTPDISTRLVECEIDYINKIVGIKIGNYFVMDILNSSFRC